MRMDLIKRGSRKFPRGSTGNLSGRVVNEETYQLTTGITGSPDNRNFHKRVSDYQNLMLFRLGRLKFFKKYSIVE
jgi:hypothetical protein